ncbi:MAG: ABC transporter ATP-binding protein, partial [Asticcacaulis sp.]
GIARALLGRPRLLILDEPTNGLDPAGVTDMRRLIRTLPEAEGVTVFVSSHLLGEVEQMATHVGLMSGGQLIAQSDLPALLASAGRTVELRCDRIDDAIKRLEAAGIAAGSSPDGGLRVALAADGAPRPQDINRLLVESGFDVSALSVKQPTLEDIFLTRTQTPMPAFAA